jgi:hypothetical protein
MGPREAHWMRGYYYARQPLGAWAQVSAGDLLAVPTPEYEMGQGAILYKHLDGPWYLYSDHGHGDD